MTKHTFTATFGTHTYSRVSEHEYPWASKRDGRTEARFHKTYAAAKRAAGTWGTVVQTVRTP